MQSGLIVANPRAADGAVGRTWKSIERSVHASFGAHEVAFTSGPGDATRIVREAVLAGKQVVIAVGGDGTINECVNGLVPGGKTQLGVFPAGTGSDLARSIGIRETTSGCSIKRVDLGRVTCVGRDGALKPRMFLNIASMGSSGLIVDKVNNTSKRFGAKASFMWGTVKGLVQYANRRVRLRVDDVVDEEVVANTIAVANGRYFGGGMMIAPDAKLDDGMFDVVLIGDIGFSFFVRYSSKLYAGTHTTLEPVKVFRGRRVTVEPLPVASASAEPMLVETDGEQPGAGPATFEVLPGALELLGRWAT